MSLSLVRVLVSETLKHFISVLGTFMPSEKCISVHRTSNQNYHQDYNIFGSILGNQCWKISQKTVLKFSAIFFIFSPFFAVHFLLLFFML